jgi:glycosyltransferase involved in cell wall biosynthesis
MYSLAIVIPCYNVENYLRTAVASVLAQERQVDEIILVDNNSTDRTYAVMEELATLNEKIFLFQQPKSGASAARNMGWQAAKSDYIHFLDADDYLLPGSVEKKMKRVEEEHCDFLINGHIRINEQGTRKDYKVIDDIYKGLFNGLIGGSSSNIIKRSMLVRVGGWNEELASSQEITLYFEILKRNPKVSIEKESLSIVLDREGQISKSDPRPRWQRLLNLRASILGWLVENKKEYWLENESYYLQSLFNWLHIAYPYCPELCLVLYRQWIVPFKFVPKETSAVSKFFLILFRLFGFQKAEQIKSWMKR